MERMKGGHLFFYALVVVTSLLLWHCGPDEHKIEPPRQVQKTEKETPKISYKIVKSYPHDTTSYTEGFLFYDGKWIESTGAPSHLPQTRSAIGYANLETGEFEKKVEL